MTEPLKPDDVKWVVNDFGELGVQINGQFFFCYKGESLVYDPPFRDDGRCICVRRIGKREFGETVHPVRYYDDGWNTRDRYTEPVTVPNPTLGPQPDDHEFQWRNMAPMRDSSMTDSET